METFTIKHILNGYVSTADYPYGIKSHTIYHKDLTAVIKHMQTVWGAVEKEVKSGKEEG